LWATAPPATATVKASVLNFAVVGNSTTCNDNSKSFSFKLCCCGGVLVMRTSPQLHGKKTRKEDEICYVVAPF
jgi:hypothetical protein